MAQHVRMRLQLQTKTSPARTFDHPGKAAVVNGPYPLI
jgi:hypothetical protein